MKYDTNMVIPWDIVRRSARYNGNAALLQKPPNCSLENFYSKTIFTDIIIGIITKNQLNKNVRICISAHTPEANCIHPD